MDLIQMSVELINDVQGLRRDFRSGKIALDTYCKELDGICQIEKLANVIIKTRITEERFKKPLIVDYKQLPEPEVEMVKCLGCNKQIERNLCLDYSGSQKFEECDGCEIGKQTKNLLLKEIV